MMEVLNFLAGDFLIEFITILRDIILPVFVIMTFGFILQKKFSLDVQTLARINIYYVVPAFIFVRLYSTEIALDLFVKVLFFIGIFVFILYILSRTIGRLMGHDSRKNVTFTNSVIFYNSGNYAVPVNDLVFRGDPFAMSIQVIVLMFQNMFIFSYGIFSLQSIHTGKLRAAIAYFKMPVMYAMLGRLLLGAFDIGIPNFNWVPANYIADTMI